MDNKRLLIAAVLSMAVLFGWQLIFPPPEPTRPPLAGVTAETTTAPEAPPSSGDAAASATTSPAVSPEPAAPQGVPLAAAEERRETLANDAPAGGLQQSRRCSDLSRSGAPGKKNEWLELVAPRRASPYPFSLVASEGAAAGENGALFTVDRAVTSAGEELSFRYRGPLGEAQKRFLLRPDGRIEFDIVRPSERGFALRMGPGCARARRRSSPAASTPAGGLEYWRARPRRSTRRRPTRSSRSPARTLDWAGLEDTYFLTALVPLQPWAKARYRPVLLMPTGEEARTFDAQPMPLPPAELSAADKALATRLSCSRSRSRTAGSTAPPSGAPSSTTT